MSSHKNDKASSFEIAFTLAKYSSRRKKNGRWLGALWSLLEPLLLFLIILTLRSQLGGAKAPYYAIYLFLGLTGFHFYTQGTRRLMASTTSNASYIKTFPLSPKVYILAGFIELVTDFCYQFLIVLALLIWYSLPLIYFIPFVFSFMLLTFFTYGLGLILAGINIYFRDIQIIWGLFNRVMFFATPIFYTYKSNMWFCKYNPLTWYLHSLREILINHNMDVMLFFGLFILSASSYFLGLLFFNSLEQKFAEIV